MENSICVMITKFISLKITSGPVLFDLDEINKHDIIQICPLPPHKCCFFLTSTGKVLCRSYPTIKKIPGWINILGELDNLEDIVHIFSDIDLSYLSFINRNGMELNLIF